MDTGLRTIPFGRLVDLSHVMIPGKEEYGLSLETKRVDEILPQYRHDADVWYILQDIHMSSHCGTHIELPYHHLRTGADAEAFPLDRLVGEALVLDFRHKQPNEAVEIADLEPFAGRILPGDMIIFHFDCSKHYGTARGHDRPYLTQEAVRWLIAKEIQLIGSDASGIEVKGVPNQPNHQALFEHNIPIIEFLANLDQLTQERVWLMALPMKLRGLDSSPVRVIAIER